MFFIISYKFIQGFFVNNDLPSLPEPESPFLYYSFVITEIFGVFYTGFLSCILLCLCVFIKSMFDQNRDR